MQKGSAGGSTKVLSSLSVTTRNFATSFLNLEIVSKFVFSSSRATDNSALFEASISSSITKFSMSSTFLPSLVLSDLLHSQQKQMSRNKLETINVICSRCAN